MTSCRPTPATRWRRLYPRAFSDAAAARVADPLTRWAVLRELHSPTVDGASSASRRALIGTSGRTTTSTSSQAVLAAVYARPPAAQEWSGTGWVRVEVWVIGVAAIVSAPRPGPGPGCRPGEGRRGPPRLMAERFPLGRNPFPASSSPTRKPAVCSTGTKPDERRGSSSTSSRDVKFDQRWGSCSRPRLYVYAASSAAWCPSSCVGRAEAGVELISGCPGSPATSPFRPTAWCRDPGRRRLLPERTRADPVFTSTFPDPIALAFSSGHPRGAGRGAQHAVSITFAASYGELAFETTKLPAPEEGARPLARHVHLGRVVYLVDETAVYAYLASDRRLVPVALRATPRSRSADGPHLREPHLLHSDHVRRYPRTQPSTSPGRRPRREPARLARALRLPARNGLLARAHDPRPERERRLDALLFENGALLTPPATPGKSYGH